MIQVDRVFSQHYINKSKITEVSTLVRLPLQQKPKQIKRQQQNNKINQNHSFTLHAETALPWLGSQVHTLCDECGLVYLVDT